MHRDLTQGSIKEHILKLAFPAVTGYFFHTLFNVTDTLFAGMISTQALAALSLSASIFFMVLAIGMGMSEAVTALVGNALGEKNDDKARHITLNTIVFGVFVSLFVSVSGITVTPYLVAILSDPSYVQETLNYINIILYGAIFFVGAFFFSALLNAIGDTKSFRNVLIFTAFLNILLDYIFLEYFKLGISGIAFATLLCEIITLSYLTYKIMQTKLWSGFKEFSYDGAVIRSLFKQGIPPSVNMFLMAFGMYIITYFVAPYGKEAVAAFGIGMRIEQVFLMPVVGLNIAALAIISQNNGAKAYGRIKPTLALGIKYGWIMSTVGVSMFLLFAENLAALLTTDMLVIQQTALYLRVSGVASYGFVIIFLYIAMLQGIAKPAVIMPISIYRQVVAPIFVFTLLASFDLSILSLWIGLNTIIFSSAIFLWWYGEKNLGNLIGQSL